MAVVLIDKTSRTWAVVHDVSITEDRKLQGTLFCSDSNMQKTQAFCKGIARNLQHWTFFARCIDNTDNKEFVGTSENKAKYPDHTPLPHVFDNEDDIIFEGFSLEEGSLPSCVIKRLTSKLKQH